MLGDGTTEIGALGEAGELLGAVDMERPRLDLEAMGNVCRRISILVPVFYPVAILVFLDLLIQIEA